jgi:hypothetical protein
MDGNNMNNINFTAFAAFLTGMLVAVILSASITIWAINTAFSTSISTDFETIFAVAYLQFLVGSMIAGIRKS